MAVMTGAAVVYLPGDLAQAVAIGAACGWLMTPDLDLPIITHEENRIRRRLPIVGRLWLAYWAPYGYLFTHHGVSHWPILGTATRAVYALWWVPLLVVWPIDVDRQVLLACFGAWALQDMYHLAADGWDLKFRI